MMPRLDKRSPKEVKDWLCLDCKVDTFHNGEYYMVQFDLWYQAVPKGKSGMLCIGCLENRLGRQLTPADFLDAPLNQVDFHWPNGRIEVKSPRLLNRLGAQ